MTKRDIITLSKKTFEREVDTALSQSRTLGFSEGLEAGVRSLICTMLNQGCHPKFLAKMTDLPVEHILAINDIRLKE